MDPSGDRESSQARTVESHTGGAQTGDYRQHGGGRRRSRARSNGNRPGMRARATSGRAPRSPRRTRRIGGRIDDAAQKRANSRRLSVSGGGGTEATSAAAALRWRPEWWKRSQKRPTAPCASLRIARKCQCVRSGWRRARDARAGVRGSGRAPLMIDEVVGWLIGESNPAASDMIG